MTDKRGRHSIRLNPGLTELYFEERPDGVNDQEFIRSLLTGEPVRRVALDDDDRTLLEAIREDIDQLPEDVAYQIEARFR